MKLRDIRPGVYRDAAQREGTTARRHFRTGNYQLAAVADQARAIQFALYREALKLVAEGRADNRASRRLVSDGRQKSMARPELGHHHQVNRLLGYFGIASIGQQQAASAPSLSDWMDGLATRAGKTGDVFIPTVADWLFTETGKPRDWRDLTATQMHELRLSLESIYKTGRDHFKALAGKRDEDLQARIAAVVARIDASSPDLTRPFQAPPTLPQRYIAENAPIDRFVYELDGGPGGPLAEAVLFIRNDIEARAELGMREATKRSNAIFDRLTPHQRATVGSPRRIHGVRKALSPEQVMVMALYEGTETGRQRNRNTFTDDEIAAALRTLTREQAAWINETWAFTESYWPETHALIERAYGPAPPKLAPMPFTIVNDQGEALTFTGGYVKASYYGQAAHEHEAANIAEELRRGAGMRQTVRFGARFERVREYGEELRYDFGVVMEGVGESVTALAMVEGLRDINFVMRNKAVREAIIRKRGMETYQQFLSAIDALGVGTLQRQSAWERTALHFRRGMVGSKFGIKVGTNAINLTGIMNGVDVLGPDALAEFTLLSSNPRLLARAAREMHAESPTMATRWTSFNRDELELRSRGRRTFGSTVLAKTPDIARPVVEAALTVRERARPITTWLNAAPMAPMSAGQLLVDTAIYRVAKRQAVGRGDDIIKAIHVAEQTVKDTQGSGFPADLPQVMRAHKNLTLFMGFTNRTVNLTLRRARMSRGVIGAGRSAMTILLTFGLMSAAQVAYWGLRGDEDDEPFGLSTLKEALMMFFGGWVGIREFASAIRRGDYDGPTELAIVGEVARVARGLGDGEWDDAETRAALSGGGILTGLPTSQGMETWRGTEAFLDGDAGPQAILLGPPRNR